MIINILILLILLCRDASHASLFLFEPGLNRLKDFLDFLFEWALM